MTFSLRSWRASLCLTQPAAADLLGVPLRTYARWEAKGVPYPKLVELACTKADDLVALQLAWEIQGVIPYQA